MGTLKNSWLRAGALLAVLLFGYFLSIGAIINTSTKSEKFADQTWYYTSGNATLKSSYTATSNPNCGNGDDVICSIKAPADPLDPTKPHMTTTVVNNINAALADGEVNSTVQSFRSN
ncbi:hypothetical protein [Sphingobacterium kyonggiense]